MNHNGSESSTHHERPRVLLHYAQTLDGRIATRGGSSQWISGPGALRLAHELRAGHDAVMVGLGTVLADNPHLTVRHVEGPDPWKVVLDSRLSTPDTSALLAETPERCVMLTTPAAPAERVAQVQRLGARVEIVPAADDGRVDLRAALGRLYEIGIRSVMVEGGARVITGLLQERLVDRLVLCLAPIILGRGVEAVGDLDIAELARALELDDLAVQRLGHDLILSGNLASERCENGPAPGQPCLRGSALLPTRFGAFELRAYEVDGVEYPVVIKGNLAGGPPPLVRLHSECLTGEALGSLRCDCGQQLEAALQLISEAGRGCVVYLRQEGRGIGLINKVRAYALQDRGLDTVQANLELGLPTDAREYGPAAQVLQSLGVNSVCLITNNPLKIAGLEEHGIEVVERVAVRPILNPTNRSYLETKVARLGHVMDIA